MLIPVRAAAEELGISRTFLYRLINQGRVPYFKLTERTTRVDLDELRSLMKTIAQGRPEGEQHG